MDNNAVADTHKIYTITSLSHSGSTVFSMALACHQQLVTVGEVFQVVRKHPRAMLEDKARDCSCGKHASECEFWGPVLRALGNLNYQEGDKKYDHVPSAYEIVAQHFHSIYGDDRYMVDTSKGLHHIEAMIASTKLTPNAVFLLRDVRAYANSQTRLASKQNRKGLKKVKTHFWFQILKWYFGNRKREKLLLQTNTPYTTVGYDAFCFEIGKTLANVYEAMDLPPVCQDEDLSGSAHHVLFGNPMRLEPCAHAEIRYDSRWFSESGYILPLALMPFIQRYNKRKVYKAGV